MTTLRLIHWKDDEARERAARLEECGYTVEWRVRTGRELLAELKGTKASAIVIDLQRLPAQGRDVAIYVRRRKATRRVPIVFVGGEEAKVAEIRRLLPDAIYTSWTRIAASLERALTQQVGAAVVPSSIFAAYAGRPLGAKLGIRSPGVVALLHAPPGFVSTLGDVAGVTFVTRLARDVRLAMWFPGTRAELDARIEAVASRVAGFPIWIAWPKRVGRSASDLTQQEVRRAGLAAGLVDYKICSIDDTWSALLFRRRK